MKIKFALLLGLLFFVESLVYAEAIIQRRFPTKKTAIQSSTQDLNEVEFNSNLFQPAIKELKEKISKNPTNYELNANLVALYLKAEEYEKALDELLFLKSLNHQKRLSEKTINTLNTTFSNIQKKKVYPNEKVLLCSNLAILSLINGNNQEAEQYILKATTIGSAPEVLTKAIYVVSTDSNNYTFGINACDNIISKNSNATLVRKIKAELLEASGKTKEAIKEYSMVIGLSPEDNETKYRLFKLLDNLNYDNKDIISTIYAGRQIKEATAYYDLAKILLDNNNLEEAKFYAEHLTKNQETKTAGYTILSEIYRKQGDLKGSYKALDEVKNNLNGKEEIKNYNVQKAKLSNNPIEEVRQLMRQRLFEQALTILNTMDQNNLDVLMMSSISHSGLKNKEEALTTLNKAMTLYPNNVQVYMGFASHYLDKLDFEAAKKYINEAKKLTPSDPGILGLEKVIFTKEAESYLTKITTAYEMQNYKEAERLTDEALRISKDAPMINYYKGILLINQNKYEKSTAYLYKCIELQKNNYNAYYNLAVAFENLGEKENAIINYKKYLDYLPSDAYDETERKNEVITRIKKLQG